MFITLLLSLYTSRIILKNLGVEDFGVYNVIAGVISALTFCSIPLTTSAQRFLSIELGRGAQSRFKSIFKSLLVIHILFAVLLIVLFETIGLYFTLNKLNIPSTSTETVFWVYQFACIAFIFSILRIPFTSSVIAQERMDIYAYLAIADTIFKLVIAILIAYSPVNRLFFYSLLLAVSQIIITVFYFYYGNANKKIFRHETKEKLNFKSYRTIMSFMFWNIFSGIASVSLYQGTNILLNIFYGPVANAARAISVQVDSAIDMFASNIRVAFAPASFKSIAANQDVEVNKLLDLTTKFSIILILFISIPIFIETEYILSLWLGEIPDGTIDFVRLMIVSEIVNCISSPLVTIIQGAGNIKQYQIINGITIFMLVPLSYFFMKIGFSENTPMIIYIFISFFVLFQRIYFTNKYFPINWKQCLFRLVIYSTVMPVVVAAVPYIIYYYMPGSFLRLLTVTISSTIILVLISYFFILDSSEKILVREFIKAKFIAIKR
jgi:hypothetical protein